MAVITGGGTGVGAAVALALASAGAEIYLIGRRSNLLQLIVTKARNLARRPFIVLLTFPLVQGN